MPNQDALQAPFIRNSLSINLAMVANVLHEDTQSAVLNVANHLAIAPGSEEASRAVLIFTEATPLLQRRFCGYFCGYHGYQFRRKSLRIKNMCLISGGEGVRLNSVS